jgi:hypothetical protein
VPLELLSRLLVTPDAHLITLRDPFVGYVMPSKVYGCVQSGRRVLYVGSEASDVHLICSEQLPADAYQQVPTGCSRRLAASLELIADQAAGRFPRAPGPILPRIADLPHRDALTSHR